MKNRVAFSHGRYARRPELSGRNAVENGMASSLRMVSGASMTQQRRVEFLLNHRGLHRHLLPLPNSAEIFRTRMKNWNVADHAIFILVLGMLLTLFAIMFFVPVKAADVTVAPFAAFHYFVDPLKTFLSAF